MYLFICFFFFFLAFPAYETLFLSLWVPASKSFCLGFWVWSLTFTGRDSEGPFWQWWVLCPDPGRQCPDFCNLSGVDWSCHPGSWWLLVLSIKHSSVAFMAILGVVQKTFSRFCVCISARVNLHCQQLRSLTNTDYSIHPLVHQWDIVDGQVQMLYTQNFVLFFFRIYSVPSMSDLIFPVKHCFWFIGLWDVFIYLFGILLSAYYVPGVCSD